MRDDQQALPLESEGRRPEWQLDTATRRTGLKGVGQARAALQQALRDRAAA